MPKPDSQQRGLSGEYYVASMLSRLGYDVAMTVGRAKRVDMLAVSSQGKAIHIQVKSTYHYNDWLVAHEFETHPYSLVALVRLGKDCAARPELYFIQGVDANAFISHKYKTHSPRVSRSDVLKTFKDHDFRLIHSLLE